MSTSFHLGYDLPGLASSISKLSIFGGWGLWCLGQSQVGKSQQKEGPRNSLGSKLGSLQLPETVTLGPTDLDVDGQDGDCFFLNGMLFTQKPT